LIPVIACIGTLRIRELSASKGIVVAFIVAEESIRELS
jgi:hypothetical protein